MPTVTHDQYEKLARQVSAMLRVSGGFERFMEVLFEAVSSSKPPAPPMVASDPRTGREVTLPENPVDITQEAWDTLFSEDPIARSLWFLLNVELGEASLRLGAPLTHTTKDELRILDERLQSIPDSPGVLRLKKRLAEVQDRTRPFDVPDVGVR